MIEKEKTPEIIGTFVARLGDLGLGNPEGIPSMYAESTDTELQELAKQYTERLVDVEDDTALRCIDGRHTINNADGSPAVTRLARVGGSASNFGVALNAGAAIVNEFTGDDDMAQRVGRVDAFVAAQTGYDRSAHLGGCGGANGEIADHKAIHENPAIMNAVEAFMALPDVQKYFGVTFNLEIAEQVRKNAGETAAYLEANNWDGQSYVDGVKEDNPFGVEDLEVDHGDETFHGHKENTLTIIIGDETLDGDDDFVWNLKASKEVAEALAGGRGKKAYTQALIAEIAKHMSVANRLPGKQTPILLLAKKDYALAA